MSYYFPFLGLLVTLMKSDFCLVQELDNKTVFNMSLLSAVAQSKVGCFGVLDVCYMLECLSSDIETVDSWAIPAQ